MVDVILAIDNNGGIGDKGEIPWHCSEDLKIFKTKTMDSILIMGRKTYDTLPKLPGREIYVLTNRDIGALYRPWYEEYVKYFSTYVLYFILLGGVSTKNIYQEIGRDREGVRYFNDLQTAITTAMNTGKKVFVSGGASIYNQVLSNRHKIDTVHISVMKEAYVCDTSVSCMVPPFGGYLIKSKSDYQDFTHYELKPVAVCHGEYQYLRILEKIMKHGERRNTRNAETTSCFSEHMTFDLRDGFPLLTTKRMFFRGIVEELLFFIRGDTNSKKLEDKKVNIWRGNTNREFLDSIDKHNRKEGMMGPMYGAQWRHFNGEYNEETGEMVGGVDQLSEVVRLIKHDPHSRRILLTSYNPAQVYDGVLFPCHSLTVQFYVHDNFLDMFCYNRSQDFFHGNPFNIASSSLLLVIIAKLTGKTPRNFHLSMGDCHIYSSHEKVVKTQIGRTPFVFPTMNILKNLQTLEDVDNLKYEDIELVGYQSHSSLKAEMVA
jgi:thymidylate synthase